MVGCVHPCKAYGAFRLGKPVIVFGPPENHLSDFLSKYKVGWQIAHGDVEGAKRVIEEVCSMSDKELYEMGERAKSLVETELKKELLCGQFCDILEDVAQSAESLGAFSTAREVS